MVTATRRFAQGKRRARYRRREVTVGDRDGGHTLSRFWHWLSLQAVTVLRSFPNGGLVVCRNDEMRIFGPHRTEWGMALWLQVST
jgi:hypothetical protein